jgi:HD-GYP domain-containing protein (c-di-GMP phosphodiesterase class II)
MVHGGKRIPLTDLRQGMFVADVFNENDVMLFSARTLITSDQQITKLKSQGVRSVYIVSDEPTFIPAGNEVAAERAYLTPSGESILAYAHYQQQIKAAAVVHEQVLDTVGETMNAAKMGSLFNSNDVAQSTERLVERIILDPDIYFALMLVQSAGGYVHTHSLNVAIMTAAFASALNYGQDTILDIALGGILHDIGKMKLPENLWMKNGSCSRREFETFKLHPELGLNIIAASGSKLSELTRAVVGHHHERWNGGGYPAGLSGKSIHEAALICAITDEYDLLTTPTPYHAANTPQEALARIFHRADDEYPRPLVERFARLLGIYPVGSFVNLKSGEKGLVIRVNRAALLTPVVVILIDGQGRHLENPFVRDLSKGSTHPSDSMHYKIECSLDPVAYGIFPGRYFKTVAS